MTEDTNLFHNLPVDIQKHIIAIVKKTSNMYKITAYEMEVAYEEKQLKRFQDNCVWMKKYEKYKKMTTEELKKIIKEKTKIKNIQKIKKEELVKIAGDLYDDGINYGKKWFGEDYEYGEKK
jgi:ABC-type dipeptide/oligopeptide/nickel transport system ATPase subunit